MRYGNRSGNYCETSSVERFIVQCLIVLSVHNWRSHVEMGMQTG